MGDKDGGTATIRQLPKGTPVRFKLPPGDRREATSEDEQRKERLYGVPDDVVAAFHGDDCLTAFWKRHHKKILFGVKHILPCVLMTVLIVVIGMSGWQMYKVNNAVHTVKAALSFDKFCEQIDINRHPLANAACGVVLDFVKNLRSKQPRGAQNQEPICFSAGGTDTLYCTE